MFKSFLSTVTPFRPSSIFAQRRVLADPTTGSPVGIQNDNANGPDGIWVPIDVTAAQLAAPTPGMLADLNAVFRLNVAPYTRYVSNGTQLISQDPSQQDIIPATGPLANVILYSPVVITDPTGLTVLGQARVELLFWQNIAMPVQFRWTPTFNFYYNAGAYSTPFDITSLIPAVTNTWYVDPVNGVDGTGVVNDPTHPLKLLTTALGKANVDQVQIINLTANFVARTTAGWNNTQCARSVSVINSTAFRFISVVSASSVAPVWSLDTGTTYTAALTKSQCTSVVDLKFPTVVTNPITGSVMPPSYQVLRLVANAATVRTTPGSWFGDNTTIWVNASDGRSLVSDNFMQPMANSNNFRAQATTSGLTTYVEGIDFVGGNAPAALFSTSGPVLGTVAFKMCSFQGSGYATQPYTTAGPNGLSCIGQYTVYLYRCGAYYNVSDGFNYHSFSNDGTTSTDSPNFFENDCYSFGNGTTGSTGPSDNATTSHDYANGIRLNGYYQNSDDTVLADTNFAFTWNLGDYVGANITAGTWNVGALISSKVFLDGCTLAASAAQVNIDVGATVYYRNMSTPTKTGIGTLTTY